MKNRHFILGILKYSIWTIFGLIFVKFLFKDISLFLKIMDIFGIIFCFSQISEANTLIKKSLSDDDDEQHYY